MSTPVDGTILLQRLLDALDDGVLVVDDEGRVLFANRAFEGYAATPTTLVGRPCGAVFEELARRFVEGSRLVRWTERARAHHAPLVERNLSLADGRNVSLESRPLALSADRNAFALLVREVENRDEADAGKDTFTAMVSHELRTPVAGIVGMTELLLQSRLAPDHRDAVSTIARSAQGLLELLNDLLDYAKIRAGKFEIHAEPCRLDRELADACNALETIARGRGLQLLVNVDPELREKVNVDATRVRQVLTNLLGNALKFTPSGCVRVEVTVTGGDHVRVEVEDSGVGVPPEKAERLFEAFYQGDATTSRQFKGTGLGLAISREIVHALGGEIGYFPNPIVGSTFWFEIPLERLGPSVSSPPVAQPSVEVQVSNAGTVLLAEDDPVNRRVLTMMVAKLGYDTVVVEDGEAAVAAAKDRPFCCILMDCMMPGMDGYTATRLIRGGKGPNAKAPILALTANAMRGDRERCLEAGMDDHIAKPVGFQQLEGLLARWRKPPEAPPEEPSALTFLPPEVRDEVCGIYDRETTRRIALARAAIHAGDLVALAAVAHDVAGSSGALHVTGVAECAYQIEHGARGGVSVATLAPILDELERRFTRWREALSA
jgi:signal transduction histidine kinase/CheY-like chemotaxis protein